MMIHIFKVIHLVGVLMTFLSFGGLIMRGMIKSDDVATRKLGGITNGIGLLLAFIGGFGYLGVAKMGFDGWVMIKIVIWVIFGGLIAVINRKPELGKVLWFVIILLGAVAAYLARVKPF